MIAIVRTLGLCCMLLLVSVFCRGEDGYRLWLRYDKVYTNGLLQQYRSRISSFVFYGNSATLNAAKNELKTGLQGLLDKKITESNSAINGGIVFFTKGSKGVSS